MPGAVPLDDLPVSLRGKAVPLDDLPPAAAPKPAAAPVAPAAKPAPSYPGAGIGINQPADIPGVGLLVNSGEALLNAGAKAASGYAGLLGTVLPGPEGQGADWQRRTNEKLHTDFTPNKDPLVNVPGQLINAAAEPLNNSAPGRAVTNFVENTPGVKEGLEGSLDIAALLGTAGPISAARAPINASREAIASSERLLGSRRGAPANDTVVPGPGDKSYLGLPIAEASRAGINVTPWEVQQGVPGGAQSVTGSTRAGFGTGAVNKETAMGNAPRINELGIRGMPEGIQIDPRTGRIEPNVIEGAKNVERAKYDAVRQVPGDGTSIELQRELGGLARGLDAVPDVVRNDVTRIIRTHAAGGPSTKLVEDIMTLRQEATMNGKRAFQQNDPTARQLASYQRQVADVLQEELARRGDAAGLVGVRETLQEARVNFAKIATLEEALDDGFIDAARLEKVTEGGGFLSDGLEDVSRFNQSASVSMTHPKRITQAIEPNFRAGATPTDVAARSAQFIGGNWLTKKIGKGGVNAINEELRGFRVPEQPAAPRAPPFEFERAPEPMGPPFPTGQASRVPPPAPNSVPPGVQPYDRLSDRLAPDFNPEVLEPATGAPKDAAISSFLAETSPDTIPWEAPGSVKPVSPAGQGSISSDLGPVSEFPALNEGIEGPGIINRPRGVTGPKSASLKDPQLSDDLVVGDQPPPREPDFGPADEFPTPPAPPESGVVSVTPTEHMVYHNGQAEGPFTTRETADGALAYMQENSPAAPAGSISDELSLAADDGSRATSELLPDAARSEAELVDGLLRLYRGSKGDPAAVAGGANGRHFSPDRDLAESYGPNVIEEQYPATDFHDAGTLQQLGEMAGLTPEQAASTTVEELLATLGKRADRPKGYTYKIPGNLGHDYREYFRFGDEQPAGGNNVSDIIGPDPTPAKPDIIGTPPAAPGMAAAQSKFDELSQQIATDPRFKDLQSDVDYVTDAIAVGDMEEVQAGIRDLTMKMAGRQPSTARAKPRTE